MASTGTEEFVSAFIKDLAQIPVKRLAERLPALFSDLSHDAATYSRDVKDLLPENPVAQKAWDDASYWADHAG